MKIRQGALASACGEEVADPRRADADEHLDEVRPREREERHPRLARHRAGEQRLARARRADQQHALGDPPAEGLVLLGRPEELGDLAELGSTASSLPATSAKRDPDVGLAVLAVPAPGERHRRAQPAAPVEDHPDQDAGHGRASPAGCRPPGPPTAPARPHTPTRGRGGRAGRAARRRSPCRSATPGTAPARPLGPADFISPVSSDVPDADGLDLARDQGLLEGPVAEVAGRLPLREDDADDQRHGHQAERGGEPAGQGAQGTTGRAIRSARARGVHTVMIRALGARRRGGEGGRGTSSSRGRVRGAWVGRVESNDPSVAMRPDGRQRGSSPHHLKRLLRLGGQPLPGPRGEPFVCRAQPRCQAKCRSSRASFSSAASRSASDGRFGGTKAAATAGAPPRRAWYWSCRRFARAGLHPMGMAKWKPEMV